MREKIIKEYLVKDVKTPLSRIPHHHPRFFQKEVGDFSTIWLPTWTELDFKVFSLQKSEGFPSMVSKHKHDVPNKPGEQYIIQGNLLMKDTFGTTPGSGLDFLTFSYHTMTWAFVQSHSHIERESRFQLA